MARRENSRKASCIAPTRAGKVVLTFGKPVAWVGFDAEQARRLGELLIQRANEAAS